MKFRRLSVRDTKHAERVKKEGERSSRARMQAYTVMTLCERSFNDGISDGRIYVEMGTLRVDKKPRNGPGN